MDAALKPGTTAVPAALEFVNIDKAFFGVPVLRQVSLTVPAGHTVGLVGENGAGKSTLMNILGGNQFPEGGQMRLSGRAYAPQSPEQATAAGIAFIHQELNLFANLSIAENLFLTAFPRRRRWPVIHRAELRRRTRELLQQVELPQAPDTPVEHLSAGERQLVEIAKALSIDARVIIFDEPTTSLTDRETARLFALIERLRARGITLIYISHILSEVLRLCDDIVVLRDGEVVGQGPRSAFTRERLITLMVGRNLNQLYPPRRQAPRDEPVLEVRGLSQPGSVENISLQLRRGEILGLAGLMGSGRSELARILFGLDPFARGEIRLNEAPLPHPSPRANLRRGMAFLTENRREEGLCLEASIADNLVLAGLRQYARPVFKLLAWGRLQEAIMGLRQAVRLTEKARNDQSVKTLSGGSQQKVVFAKWLLCRPSVFILDEPTRGIDVGAKFEVYSLIRQLAADGAGILMISSEMDELIGLCDRILVLRRGAIMDELRAAEFDRERILRSALHEGKEG